MTRIRIECADGKSSVTATDPSEPAQALEGVALDVLISGLEEDGYGKARDALAQSGNAFIMGILAGLYKDDGCREELIPVFRVLMALFGIAKGSLGVEDGQEDEDAPEGEYRIVEGDE